MKYLTYCLILLFTLTGCIADNLPECETMSGNGKMFISLRLTVPGTGDTRAFTDNDGTSSEGTLAPGSHESAINNVSLIFCKAGEIPENDEVVYTISGFPTTDLRGYDNNFKGTISIELDEPDVFLDKVSGEKLRLYIVANNNYTYTRSDNLLPKNGKLSFPSLSSLGTYAEGRYLPLVNASPSKTLDLTNVSAEDLKKLILATSDNTLDISESNSIPSVEGLGTIDLERAVARIDYLDESENNSHIFKIGDSEFYVKIESLQPFNVSKEEWIFRHTADGSNKEVPASQGNYTLSLFGTENGSTNSNSYKWIADIDWNNKNIEDYKQIDFFNGLGETGYISGNVSLMPVTELDNLDPVDDYFPWQYVSENTVPSVDAMIKGLSTGVAFNVLVGKMENNVFLTFTAEMMSSDTEHFYQAEDGSWQMSLNGQSAPLYASAITEGGYNLTYLYFIRHNHKTGAAKADDGKQTDAEKRADKETTDPMEFAVVRNNIYRLKVTGFNSLPDDYNPEDPCESLELDIAVQLSINAWYFRNVEMEF